nr:MAG TPA: hypothetical protein [Caudoviricetes sp.]
MRHVTLESMTDEVFGKVGCEKRDAMERRLKEDADSFAMGSRLKETRESQNLTQEQLGRKAGVKREQVSRLERGKAVTLSAAKRITQALGVVLW